MSETVVEKAIDTSAEACAVACMLVSNPQGAIRKDGDGWQKRVNDLIRTLRDERDAALSELAKLRETLESARDGINLIGTALMDFAGDDPHGLVTVAINTAENLRVELEAALPSPPKDPAHD